MPNPLAINVKEERELTRTTKSTLAQLRSGYSQFLQSYLTIFDDGKSLTCTDCNEDDNTTVPIFNCPTKQKNLIYGQGQKIHRIS